MKSFSVIVCLMSVVLFTTVRSQFECPPECRCSFPTLGISVIDCSNRGLTEVLEVFHPGASSIGKIDFSNNRLTTLDIDKLYAKIQGITVEELDFSFNSINFVNGTFDGVAGKGYTTLNLSSNMFTSFPGKVIPVRHTRSQLVLDFSHNQLTELTANMFSGGTDSSIFGFQFLARNNRINRIDSAAFQGVNLVDTILDLRNNQLTTLSPSYQGPRGIEEIKLSGNPWNCDCNLRWIIDPSRFLINHTASDPPNCQTPASLRGRPLFGLQGNEFACLPTLQGLLVRDIENTDTFTLSCPVTADPPNPVISWTVWLPCPSEGDPLQFQFTSETVTLSDITTNPRAAFRCTATNNAGSVDLDLDVSYNGESGIPIPGVAPNPTATQPAVPPSVTSQSGSQPSVSDDGHISVKLTTAQTRGTSDGMEEGSGGKPVGAIIALVILLVISWLVIAILIYFILKLKRRSTGGQSKPRPKKSDNGQIGTTRPEPMIYSNVNRHNGWNGAAVHPENTTPAYATPDKGRQQSSPMKPQPPVKPAIPTRPAPPPKPSNPYQYNTDEQYDDPPLKIGLYNGGYDYNNRDSFI